MHAKPKPKAYCPYCNTYQFVTIVNIAKDNSGNIILQYNLMCDCLEPELGSLNASVAKATHHIYLHDIFTWQSARLEK